MCHNQFHSAVISDARHIFASQAWGVGLGGEGSIKNCWCRFSHGVQVIKRRLSYRYPRSPIRQCINTSLVWKSAVTLRRAATNKIPSLRFTEDTRRLADRGRKKCLCLVSRCLLSENTAPVVRPLRNTFGFCA